VLVEGTQAKQGTLDEIGVTIRAGPDQYIALLKANAQSLASCLKS
jgi:ABC-type Zn2+ transport system substrate-binding protein/surface adhesin